MKKDKNENQTTAEKAVAIFKYPASVAAGAYFVHRNSRNALYDTLKKNSSLFEKARTELTSEMNAATGNGAGMKGKIRPASIKYNKSVTEALKSKGWHNAIDYVKELHPNQQLDALIAGATAATVTYTVATTLSQNKLIGRLLHPQNSQEAQASR